MIGRITARFRCDAETLAVTANALAAFSGVPLQIHELQAYQHELSTPEPHDGHEVTVTSPTSTGSVTGQTEARDTLPGLTQPEQHWRSFSLKHAPSNKPLHDEPRPSDGGAAAEFGHDIRDVMHLILGPLDESTDHPWHRIERGELTLDELAHEMDSVFAGAGLSPPMRPPSSDAMIEALAPMTP